jgi:phosphoglycolate phosphatase
MNFNTVIFDLDGTLLDTLEDLCDSVNAMLEYFKYPEITLKQAREYVGNGAKNLIKRSLPF